MKKYSSFLLSILIQSLIIGSPCYRTTLVKKFSVSTPSLFSIAINDNCQAVATWVEQSSSWGGNGHPIVATHYSNGAWGMPLTVQMDMSKGIGDDASGAFESVVDINNSGHAVSAWYSKMDKKIYLSYYNGLTWSAEKEVVDLGAVFTDNLSVIATIRDDGLITVIYCDLARIRASFSKFNFIMYAQSTDMGDSWTTPGGINTSGGFSWNTARSDNKNIVIYWIDCMRLTLFTKTLIGATLSSQKTVVELPGPLNSFLQTTGVSIDINDSGNMAAVWAGANANLMSSPNQEQVIQSSFYSVSTMEWARPNTIIALPFVPTEQAGSISLNNENEAIIVFNDGSSAHQVFASEQFNPTNGWQRLNPIPPVAARGVQMVVCNNDSGDAVSFFSSKSPHQDGGNGNTQYRYFLSSSNRWKTVHELFDDTFIAATPALEGNNNDEFKLFDPPYAIDCKHASSNLAFITPKLEALVCCESFSSFSPINLTGSCNINRFPFQAESFASLQWSAPSDGGAVAGYSVSQNNEQIALLLPTQTSFIAHNAPPFMQNVYDVGSVDENGMVSFPAEKVLYCP